MMTLSEKKVGKRKGRRRGLLSSTTAQKECI